MQSENITKNGKHEQVGGGPQLDHLCKDVRDKSCILF